MARPMTFDTEEVVDKAVGIFWRQGFAATTPQNLVDELGIGKGSLYNTFKSKHHLFGLAMRRYSARRVAELAEGLEGPDPVLPRLREALQTLAGVGEHHLFGLAMRRYSARRVAELAEGLEGPGPVLPRLREALQTLAGVGEHQFGCLIVNSVAELGSADEVVAEVAKDLFAQVEAAFRSAIERAQATGEISSRRAPTDLAGALLAAVIGANVLAKAGSDPDHLSCILDTTLQAA